MFYKPTHNKLFKYTSAIRGTCLTICVLFVVSEYQYSYSNEGKENEEVTSNEVMKTVEELSISNSLVRLSKKNIKIWLFEIEQKLLTNLFTQKRLFLINCQLVLHH